LLFDTAVNLVGKVFNNARCEQAKVGAGRENFAFSRLALGKPPKSLSIWQNHFIRANLLKPLQMMNTTLLDVLWSGREVG
jgi:hypothetical protein